VRSLLRVAAAPAAALMVCVAAGAAGAGCGGSTLTTGPDAGSDGTGGTSGSSSGDVGASSGSGGSGSDGGGGSGSGSDSGGESGSDGGSSSGGGSGSGSGSSSGGVRCGFDPPPLDMPCGIDGMECEYGASPNPGCDQIMECLNGMWTPPPLPSCEVGTCPASYADVAQGQVCYGNGLDCAYPEGQCNCSYTSSRGVGNNSLWYCFDPAGCPEPRPRVGAPCAQPGLACDYGACTGGLLETCTGGYWNMTMTSCPG
jgi:hypothetical protein